MKKYNITKVNIVTRERERFNLCSEEKVKELTKGLVYNGFRYEKDNIRLYVDEVRDLTDDIKKSFGSYAGAILALINEGATLDYAIQSVICGEV